MCYKYIMQSIQSSSRKTHFIIAPCHSMFWFLLAFFVATTERQHAKSAITIAASSKQWEEKLWESSFPASPSIHSLLQKHNVKVFNSMITNSSSEGSCSTACTERTAFPQRAAMWYLAQHAARSLLPAALRQGGGGRHCCFAEEELRHAGTTAESCQPFGGPSRRAPQLPECLVPPVVLAEPP